MARSVRPITLSTQELFAGLAQADPGLRRELGDLQTETTDDLADPWAPADDRR